MDSAAQRRVLVKTAIGPALPSGGAAAYTASCDAGQKVISPGYSSPPGGGLPEESQLHAASEGRLVGPSRITGALGRHPTLWTMSKEEE